MVLWEAKRRELRRLTRQYVEGRRRKALHLHRKHRVRRGGKERRRTMRALEPMLNTMDGDTPWLSML